MDTLWTGLTVPTRYFDGNWIDCLSLLGGIAYSTYKSRRCAPRRKFFSKDSGLDIANGVSLVPLAILSMTIFSTSLTDALFHSNKLILSVAGLVALCSMLETRDEGV